MMAKTMKDVCEAVWDAMQRERMIWKRHGESGTTFTLDRGNCSLRVSLNERYESYWLSLHDKHGTEVDGIGGIEGKQVGCIYCEARRIAMDADAVVDALIAELKAMSHAETA